jgi:hypothetical protein
MSSYNAGLIGWQEKNAQNAKKVFNKKCFYGVDSIA